MEKEYLNINECSKFLGRSPAAVRNLVLRRRIPFRKPSGRLLFSIKELRDWIETSPGVGIEEIKSKGF